MKRRKLRLWLSLIEGYRMRYIVIARNRDNMSRSYKKSYTKSKVFDPQCRCHSRCPYCRDNRMYNTLKKIEATNRYNSISSNSKPYE